MAESDNGILLPVDQSLFDFCPTREALRHNKIFDILIRSKIIIFDQNLKLCNALVPFRRRSSRFQECVKLLHVAYFLSVPLQ